MIRGVFTFLAMCFTAISGAAAEPETNQATATRTEVANESTAVTSKPSQTELTRIQGLRFAVVQPNLEWQLKATQGIFAYSNRESFDSARGYSIGYVVLPVRQVGWTTNLTTLTFEDAGNSMGMVRLDGNIAYLLAPTLYGRGGLNASQMTWGRNAGDWDLGIGLQAGFGLQVSPRIGLDIGYVQMNQYLTKNGTDASLRESGLELGLHGTF